ncbi:MAG TPA: hypothetical protein VKL99_08685 [Candidatus Angelobacter sp.]|nr:hypothetical protein [Candidatus Angelobacter sp.]
MIKTRESLTFEIKQLSAELKRMEQQLQMGPAPDAVALNEFRQAVDNVRLTAWSVSELINAERIKKDPDKVLAFLYAERLRRFEQLVRNLCSDIERRVLTFHTNGMPTLVDSVNLLQQRLLQCVKEKGQLDFKVKDAAG